MAPNSTKLQKKGRHFIWDSACSTSDFSLPENKQPESAINLQLCFPAQTLNQVAFKT